MWGSGPTNVWTVGDEGEALHWDGTTWSPTTLTTGHGLLSVWGAGPGDIWAFGEDGEGARFH